MASDSCSVSRTLTVHSLRNGLLHRRTTLLVRLAVMLGLLACSTHPAYAHPWPLSSLATDERSLAPTPLAQDAPPPSDSIPAPAATSNAAPESTDNRLPFSRSSPPPGNTPPGGWRNLILGAVCAATLAFLGVGTLVLSMRRSILHPIEDPVPMKPRD